MKPAKGAKPKFVPSERNYDGIQFAELREKIEKPYNDIHDELSDCFYNKKPFREYGLLTKEQFDELHGLIFHHLAVTFHDENMKQPKEKQYDTEDYLYDRNGGDLVTQAKAKIKDKNDRGFKLKI